MKRILTALVLLAVLLPATEWGGPYLFFLGTDKPHKKITVHVYHPPKSLGGIMGLLDFDRDFLASMIRKGYRDTLNHVCGANGCVHP